MLSSASLISNFVLLFVPSSNIEETKEGILLFSEKTVPPSMFPVKTVTSEPFFKVYKAMPGTGSDILI